MQTEEVMKIYTRQSLIPDDEWAAISVSEIIKAEDDKARMALLPWRKARWMEGKLRTIMSGAAPERKANVYVLPSVMFTRISSSVCRT
jgi:DNA-directed RNA polymerase I subunit RPA49